MAPTTCDQKADATQTEPSDNSVRHRKMSRHQCGRNHGSRSIKVVPERHRRMPMDSGFMPLGSKTGKAVMAWRLVLAREWPPGQRSSRTLVCISPASQSRSIGDLCRARVRGKVVDRGSVAMPRSGTLLKYRRNRLTFSQVISTTYDARSFRMTNLAGKPFECKSNEGSPSHTWEEMERRIPSRNSRSATASRQIQVFRGHG